MPDASNDFICDLENEKERDYKKSYMQEQIDMSRYKYNVDESFGDIDITTFMDGCEANDETSAYKKISNRKKKPASLVKRKKHKDKERELEKILDAMDKETDKISNILFDIGANLSNNMEAKTNIESSIAQLYEKMKYANEKLPFLQNPPSRESGHLEHDENTDFDSLSISKSKPKRLLAPTNKHRERSSNKSYQKTSLLENENIGK